MQQVTSNWNDAPPCPIKVPGRWPFPPRASWLSRAGQRERSRRADPVSPSAWHSTAAAAGARRTGKASRQVVQETHAGTAGGMTRKAMILDTCMALAWAAMIPGMLWFGAAAGF